LVALCYASFGEEVFGYVQEGSSNLESECAIESDRNTECVTAERQNQEFIPIANFHSDIRGLSRN
jgi:hypothetical protein